MKNLDHYPARGELRSDLQNVYDQTKLRYEKVYGSIDETLWPSGNSTCGNYSAFKPCVEDE